MSNLVAWFLAVCLIFTSSRGLIMDVHKRKRVPLFYIAHYVFTLLDLGWFLAWLLLNDLTEDCAELKNRVNIGYAILACVFLRHQLHLAMHFDPDGELWYRYLNRKATDKQLLEEFEEHWKKRAHVDKMRNKKQMMCTKAIELVTRFLKADLTGSDIIAGLFILNVENRNWIMSKKYSSKASLEKTTETVKQDGAAGIGLMAERNVFQEDTEFSAKWLDLFLIREHAILCGTAYGSLMYALYNFGDFCRMCTNPKRDKLSNPIETREEELKRLKEFGLDADSRAEPTIKKRCLCCASDEDQSTATFVSWAKLKEQDILFMDHGNK
ncbi:hypothetical protein Ciccas_013467, partial [Cichlidogyrus casuarinus]